ncbi:MAG TPA: S8 family serine peptidase [Anaerolineaceae bacterium]
MNRSSNLLESSGAPAGAERPQPEVGCGGWILFAAVAIGILALVAVTETTSWVSDEAHYLGYYRVSGVSRAFVTAILQGVLLLPLLLLAARWRSPLLRAVYRTWAFAAGFSVLLSLGRLPGLTAPFDAHLLQVLLELAFLLFVARIDRQKGGHALRSTWGLPFALFASGCLVLPWVAVGALGSPLDTLLTLLVGLLFGIIASRLLELTLFADFSRVQTRPGQYFGLAGLGAVLTLLIMLVGVQYTGLQWYLLIFTPILGFALVAFNQAHQGTTTRLAEEDSPAFGVPAQMNGYAWLPGALLVGVSTAAALTFVDAKELSIVVGSGTGEILQWVLEASAAALVLGLIFDLAGFLAWRGLGRRGPSAILLGAAGIVWVAALAFFALAGRAQFYGDRLFVVLRSQADLSSAPAMADYNQRRTYVFQTLVQKAATTQADLRHQLDGLHIAYTPYYLVNGIEVRGGPLVKAWLQTRPEVDRVLTEPILRPLPENVPVSTGTDPAPTGVLWNQTLIGADRVWNELHVTGQGIVVGQSDSGVQGDHPELASAYRGRTSGDAYNWLDPWNHAPHPVDIGGHGTHTLGTIVGKHTGIAPGATWFACINEARNMGNPADYLNCMQYMLAPYPQGSDPFKAGDPTRSANVINNSWGCPDLEGCDPGSLQAGVSALRAAGIFVVASTGNAGEAGCGTVTDPLAIYPAAFSVGAVDSSGKLSSFSSIGPVIVDGSRHLKPDLVAPGEGVLSAFPGNTYMIESGTSMAGPHVVGVVALMWSANPGLIGNVDRTEQILEQTARPYTSALPACVQAGQRPNDGVGWGTVDAYAAVKMALEEKK